MQVKLFTQEGKLVFNGDSDKIYIADQCAKALRSQLVKDLGDGIILYQRTDVNDDSKHLTKGIFNRWALIDASGQAYRISDDDVPKNILTMELLLK